MVFITGREHGKLVKVIEIIIPIKVTESRLSLGRIPIGISRESGYDKHLTIAEDGQQEMTICGDWLEELICKMRRDFVVIFESVCVTLDYTEIFELVSGIKIY